MTLDQWINQFPPEERAAKRLALALQMGITSESAVKHYANGTRRVPGERCAAVELFTNFEVTKHELRPDIFDPPPDSDGAPSRISSPDSDATIASAA